MICQTIETTNEIATGSPSILTTQTETNRQSCNSKIRHLESKLETLAGVLSLPESQVGACETRLKHARRFLQSEEYGGCQHELRVLALLISSLERAN